MPGSILIKSVAGPAAYRETLSRRAKTQHVLMVGPGPHVRGGITAVIAAYKQSQIWKDYSFTWLSTYDDRGPIRKIVAALRAYLLGPSLISRADIVHVHGVFRKSFIRKLPLILLAKAMRKRVIYHVHAATLEGAFNGPVAPLIRWTLALVDKVIAISPGWAASIQSQCPRASIATLLNPVIIPAKDNLQQTERNEPRILFLGKLEPRKGFRDLLMAMPGVLAAVPAAKLVFAGDGDIESARMLAADLGISSSVALLGFVRGEDKTRELRSSSVVCLPSYDEGMPVALLEAMSRGIPVVATTAGGIPELVHSGKNGLLVSPGDVQGLTRAIVDLLTDPHLSVSIGTAGFMHVERFHSLDHVCTLLEGIYVSLGRRRGPEGGRALDPAQS
jgi:glycosyltransferase involved in cell wall biosynthesis